MSGGVRFSPGLSPIVPRIPEMDLISGINCIFRGQNYESNQQYGLCRVLIDGFVVYLRLMEQLLTFDEQVFHTINVLWQNAIFDVFLPLIRNKYIWLPFYIFILGLIIHKFPKSYSYIFISCLLSTVIMTDLISSHLLKKSIRRIRPCHEIALENRIVERVYCGYGFSLPSSHAANHFAIATILILLFRIKRKILWLALLLWASLIGFAQIYVGVHYPIDVIAGGVLGVIVAFGGFWVYTRLNLIDRS